MLQSLTTDRVSLSEVLSALSYALDLTEGATPGHTLRTCLIGMRLAEEAGVPLLARIANLAQTLEAFHHKSGARAALRVARQRSGTWFDPMLVRLVQRWKPDDAWWALLRGDVRSAVVAAEPTDQHMQVDADELDSVCRGRTSALRWSSILATRSRSCSA